MIVCNSILIRPLDTWVFLILKDLLVILTKEFIQDLDLKLIQLHNLIRIKHESK